MAPVSLSLKEIAAAVGGRVEGNGNARIEGVAPIELAGPGQITFLANPKYLRRALDAKPGAILAAPGVDLPGVNVVRVADPYLAMARVLAVFHPARVTAPGVRPSATVGAGCSIDPSAAVLDGARLGERVVVGARSVVHPGAAIGDDCELGADTVVHANATLYPRTKLGDRVVIHSGAVLGSDGFGFAHDGTLPVKIPQVGNVIVEDDVEIGANATIDRATFGSTLVGRGVKIDNLVQVAHNVVIGAGSILVAQSGISGSTKLGKGVVVAGQSGAVGHITIGDGAKVGAKTAVTRNLPAGAFVMGHPAIEAGAWKRSVAVFARLPEILRRLRRLERAGSGDGDSEGEGE
ncbi:MAG TPA: UDP-3-O-(3-hydroxymyristoyl)glucosamine N-acyltransferase [Verrucomicrobiae bacterium]|nr:UDP-3-O-(3-hydroxymyristoyl)glucosamine N-acyltransferase [Verrucomicrobiae bacterium]